MSTVPKGRHDRLAYFRNRLRAWEKDPAAAGLDAAWVAAVREAVDRADEAARRQAALQQQARAATASFNAAIKDVARLGRGAVMQVRASGGRGDPSIYAAAQVDPKRKGSPVPPPGVPHAFKATLRGNAELELRWRCKVPVNARNVSYHVRRQCDGSGAFDFLGTFGQRRMIDNTIPAGVTEVTYEVQPVRPTGTGPIARHVVRLSGSIRLPIMQSSRDARLYPATPPHLVSCQR